MRIREWLRGAVQILRGRYVRLLENEVARLRAENMALLNSLLGTAGVPPLRLEIAQAAAAFSAAEILSATGARGGVADSKKASVAPALSVARFGAGNGGAEQGGSGGAEKERAGLKPGATQDEAGGADGASNVPLRRRSWQQIGRMLEIEEARREREHAARVAEIRERWSAENTTAQVEAPKH